MNANDLSGWRKQIDRVDNHIMKLLAERKSIAERIAKFKLINDLPIFDSKRESSLLLARQRIASKLGLNKQFTKSLMHLLMSYSKKVQERVINIHNSDISNKNEKKGEIYF